MPEQFAVDEILGNGPAVDLDERLVPPGGALVDGVGDNLLAHARLPDNQHGVLERRHLIDLRHHAPEARIRPHHLVAGLRYQFAVQIAVVGDQLLFQTDHLLVPEGVGHGDGKRFPQERKKAGMRRREPVGSASEHIDDPQAMAFDPEPQGNERRCRQSEFPHDDPAHRVFLGPVDDQAVPEPFSALDGIDERLRQRDAPVQLFPAGGIGSGDVFQPAQGRLIDVQIDLIRRQIPGDEVPAAPQGHVDVQAAADQEGRLLEKKILVHHGAIILPDKVKVCYEIPNLVSLITIYGIKYPSSSTSS